MIGLPGSGKTTAIRTLLQSLEQMDVKCVSPDSIRKELTGNTDDQSMNPEVWTVAYERTASALKAGVSVVFDATNTSGPQRRRLIEHCRRHGKDVKVLGVWLDTPLEVCLQRNAERERVVPEYVIQRMASQLAQDPPTESEFDELQRI